MGNKITFGRWEAITFLVNMMSTKAFLSFPRGVAQDAGTASWILVIYISILSFFFFIIISKLYTNFEGKDLLDIGEQAAGGFGRIVIGLLVFVVLIMFTSVILRVFAEDMKVISLTVSPISFVTLIFLVCMIFGAYFGIEAIIRLHAIAVPIIAIGYMVIVIAILPMTDFKNLLPILGNGPVDIFGKGFFRISAFTELLMLFLITPFIKTNENFKKVGFAALGFSSFFLFTSAAVYLGAISYPAATESFLPIYQMARLINYGRFFQRVEPLFVLIWASAALLYLTASFFFMIYTFKKTFKLTYYKPLIIPFAIIVFTMSLLPPNLVTAVKIDTQYLRNTTWIITFCVTILILLFARFVKRKGEKEAKV